MYIIYMMIQIQQLQEKQKIFSKKNKFKKIKLKIIIFINISNINKFPLLDAKIVISKDYNSINKKTRKITNKRSHIVTIY